MHNSLSLKSSSPENVISRAIFQSFVFDFFGETRKLDVPLKASFAARFFQSVFFSFFSISRFYYLMFLFKLLFLGSICYKLFRRASQLQVAFPRASFSPLLLLIALPPIAFLPPFFRLSSARRSSSASNHLHQHKLRRPNQPNKMPR